MAVDSTDDPTDDPSAGEREERNAAPRVEDYDDGDLVQIKRKPRSLIARKSLPTVENALDDFIISANQKLMDVAEFTPETREKQLRDEIAELEKKLEAAQRKVAAAEAHALEPPPEPKRPWGAIIGAFVVGAGVMFAINLATRPSAPAVAPLAEQPAQAAPTTATATTPAPPAPTATPPSTPPAAAAAEPPPTTSDKPPTTPTTDTPAADKPPTVAANHATKQPKQPKVTKDPGQAQAQTQAKATPKATDPATAPASDSTPKPPPAQDGSGSDLYNPF